MNLNRLNSSSGYSLIELVVVIVILGIIATVSMKTLRNTTEVARFEETKAELELLADAITGDPNEISAGGRTDFGYVGDVGALPSSLSALVTNPGYTTWQGPYISDDFSTDGSSSHVLLDAWGKAYDFAGVSIQSTGGPTTITKNVAVSSADLISNAVNIAVYDLNHHVPGSIYKDSIRVVLSYPDGAGSITSSTKYPGNDGSLAYAAIPIGIHELRFIYLPTADTLKRKVVINPGRLAAVEFQWPEEVW